MSYPPEMPRGSDPEKEAIQKEARAAGEAIRQRRGSSRTRRKSGSYRQSWEQLDESTKRLVYLIILFLTHAACAAGGILFQSQCGCV